MPNNIPIIINNIDQPSISYWINGGMLLTSICMVIITITNILQNKNLWKYDVFLKEEAKILLKFRSAYTNNEQSIRWFLDRLLTPKITYHPNAKETPIIKRKDLIKHYNKINAIYDFYRKNQYIFKKHRMDKDVNLLFLFLQVVDKLPKEDLNYTMVEKNEDCETYSFNYSEQIIKEFNIWALQSLKKLPLEKWYMKLIFGKKKPTEKELSDAIKKDIERINKSYERDQENEFEQMKQEIDKRLNNLYFKIDNMCIFPQKIPLEYGYMTITREFPYLKE